MTRYQSFNVEDFAADKMFRDWIISPTPELISAWTNWLKENPEKQTVINQAIELVLMFDQVYGDNLTQESIIQEIHEITRKADKMAESHRTTIGFYNTNAQVWKVAAVLLLTIGTGILYYLNLNKNESAIGKTAQSAQVEEMVVKNNNTNHEMTVLLDDKSVATLAKGSSLTYPVKFTSSERKVTLNGEAFFDISKNPDKPFFVFTNETVTKVHGTSFRIKAFEGDNMVMVVVKTGTVSVYEKKEYEKRKVSNVLKMRGVILNPNQQAVFVRNENRLEKGRVTNVQMLSESAVLKDLVFDEIPVDEVFSKLAAIYGISIVFDAKLLHGCIISTEFREENLKQRLNAICQAIGAGYEMVNDEIIISSKGCSQ